MVGSKALVREFRPLWHHHFGEWHHFQTIASEVRGAHIFLYAINRLERDYQKHIQKPSLQQGAERGELQTLESWVHWVYPRRKLNYLEFLHDIVKKAEKSSLPNKSKIIFFPRTKKQKSWVDKWCASMSATPHRPKRRDSRTHRKRMDLGGMICIQETQMEETYDKSQGISVSQAELNGNLDEDHKTPVRSEELPTYAPA